MACRNVHAGGWAGRFIGRVIVHAYWASGLRDLLGVCQVRVDGRTMFSILLPGRVYICHMPGYLINSFRSHLLPFVVF